MLRFSPMSTGAPLIDKNAWTEAELESLPEGGYGHEVVDGELIRSPKNNWYHGDICAELLMVMRSFAKQHHLGAVWDSSTGCWMQNRNCRAPDISFVRKERLKGYRRTQGQFFPGAPDLAVEVLSPNTTRPEIDQRLKDFFASGTQIAWIIDPAEKCVEVCYSLTNRKLVGPGGLLDGETVLPGFKYPIADLFSEWEWE